jgi:hypothetical protein
MEPSRKITVNMIPDDGPLPYSYCVLEWSDSPCLWNGIDSNGPEQVMPGTENGSWFNTGICGWEKTPEEAFLSALKRFREKFEDKKLY